MKKIEILSPQFQIEIHNEIEIAQKKMSGNEVKLKFLKEKLEEINNKQKGAQQGARQALDFLIARNLTDAKVKGENYTYEQIIIDSFAVQLHVLKLELQSFINDLIQV